MRLCPPSFFLSTSGCDTCTSTAYTLIYSVKLCIWIFMGLLICHFHVNVCMFTFTEIIHDCLCLLFGILLCGAAPWTASP